MISSRGLVDRKCHFGSLSDHEDVRGYLGWKVCARLVLRSVLSESLEGKDVLLISEIYILKLNRHNCSCNL